MLDNEDNSRAAGTAGGPGYNDMSVLEFSTCNYSSRNRVGIVNLIKSTPMVDIDG
jgi:hypothetical protein